MPDQLAEISQPRSASRAMVHASRARRWRKFMATAALEGGAPVS